MTVGDIVVLQESGTIPIKWSLGRVLEIHPGKDKLVRVVTVKTDKDAQLSRRLTQESFVPTVIVQVSSMEQTQVFSSNDKFSDGMLPMKDYGM